MYYEQLRDCLYATVVYPPDLTELMIQAHTWREFCALPASVKHQLAFPDDQDYRDPGYKERAKAAGREDKWYYHYMPDNARLVEKYGLGSLVSAEPALRHFFEFATAVDTLVCQLVLTIGYDLEAYVPGMVDQLKTGRDHFTYRYLCYTPQSPDDVVLCTPHFDRAGFTLHLYESCPGLQLLDWDGAWIPAPVDQGKTIIFTGYKLEIATKGRLQKTWHRVVRHNPPVSAEQRISIILFVPLIDIPGYPPEARSQDIKPGYASRE